MKLFFLFFLLLVLPTVSAAPEAVIYKNGACGHCSVYVEQFKEILKENEISFEEKDLLKDKNALQEVNQITKERSIPYQLQGHMVITINDLILEGHIPLPVVKELLQKYPDHNFPKITLYQDSMEDIVTDYKVLDEQGNIKECVSLQSPEQCSRKTTTKEKILWTSLPLLVLINGALAGIHPCTISVLLLFIAFLFTLRKSRFGILKVGIAYVLGIFIAYFGIGLGIFKAMTFSGSPHLAAKISAVLILILGIINVISFFSKKDMTFKVPGKVKPTILQLLQKMTIPATFLVGVLVGICSFGCTAGIYLSIMSLLTVKASYGQGVLYLLFYNLMFILPLILILIFASSKKIVAKIERIEKTKKNYLKLIAGIVMILLALLLFFITAGGM